MFPGINPKQIEKAMKQIGIKQEEIDAKEVIIKCSEKNIVIKNPHVTKIDMHGNESFQITGDVSEEFSEEDIKTIMQQTKCSREKAIKALEENNGDLAEAIISLNK